MKFRDYYQTLDVSRDASQTEIRKAFRKLARKYHPDVAKDPSSAEDQFKEINEAYEVLGDPEKRKKYDTLGHDWKHREQGASGSASAASFDHHFQGTGFSDFFEQMFSSGGYGQAADLRGFGSTSSGHRKPVPQRGHDTHADILVSLDEVIHGTERALSLRQINRETGASELKKSRIRIPKGVNEGLMIRCAGLGEPGFHGAPPGDLFLRVRLEKHPIFRVVNANLYSDLPLAPWEAILGTVTTVPTPDGEVRIKIPPMTANGTELRIKGEGLVHGDQATRGDLYTVVQITNPIALSEKEKELWKQLAAASSFNPRTP
ncbi:MAG: DnaJ domain-containing protein [Verrucomicrobiae bacterium]|nr:DnaJ domain-containing protein [Verrucomicrobiae bacterium]NNJ43813.1 DnaJ domain-containing protein [Akkermansiaceae bacterium]